ncbi:MAG: hypothetical protein HW416_3045 [Chloroflexi bacterium]|nr:hypothetical protein [Chloroflexota bacterium]
MVAAQADTRRQYTEADYTDFAHTGPGTLAGRFMRTFWQPVCCSQDLPPGRARPLHIMSEDFTLYRGESGKPHIVEFRCAHRGTQLSIGWVEGDCIRCAYHGWMYDDSGQCVEQPAEADSYAKRVRIESYPTEEYLGVIFGYFGEGEAPPLPRYPDFEEEGVLEVSTYVRNYNFFQSLENGGDYVHTAFAHGKRLRTPDGRWDIPELWLVESEWGRTETLRFPDGDEHLAQYGMPNIHNHPNGVRLTHDLRKRIDAELGRPLWKNMLAWRAVPIDDFSHRSFAVDLIRLTGDLADLYREYRAQSMVKQRHDAYDVGERVLAGDLTFDEVDTSSVALVNVGDYSTQRGQGLIADRTHERLGRSDVGVTLLRELWSREMRALAEGRPLKQWVRPPHLVPAEGHHERAGM